MKDLLFLFILESNYYRVLIWNMWFGKWNSEIWPSICDLFWIISSDLVGYIFRTIYQGDDCATMTNKKGLFTLLKRVFISEANSEKVIKKISFFCWWEFWCSCFILLLCIYLLQKEKRRRWTFWKLKVRKRLPTITAPPPENGTRNESHEEQKEESVSEVGEVSQVSSSQKLDSIEKLEGSTSPETAHLVAQYQLFLNREEEALAATRIQTAFRGHLVRFCSLYLTWWPCDSLVL